MSKKITTSEYEKGMKSERKNTFIISTCIGIMAFIVGGSVGYVVNRAQAKKVDPYLQKIIDTYHLLDNEWLFSDQVGNLKEIMADYMISGLLDRDGDPYTFYTKNEADQNLSTSGVGFGVAFGNYYGRPIIKTLHNGAMEKAGFREGDVIKSYVKNRGTLYDTFNRGYAESRNDFICVEGDVFDFIIIRNNTEMSIKNVVASTYSQRTVSLESDERVEDKRQVIIRIDTFLGNPVSELKVLIDNLLTTGNIDTLLLDVKDNGGGYVNQMANLATFFTPKGTTIYSSKNKKGETIESYHQTTKSLYTTEEIKNIKIVQNGGSASASESFTLALKDSNRATVYGTQSYGKGIAQAFYYFNDGSVIRYTYAYIYGPKDYTIHNKGITPDIVTDQGYNILKNTPDYDSSVSNYTLGLEVLKDQILYYIEDSHNENDLSSLLTIFQEEKGLSITGEYDRETYNYLSGLNYETYQYLYDLENYTIVNS